MHKMHSNGLVHRRSSSILSVSSSLSHTHSAGASNPASDDAYRFAPAKIDHRIVKSFCVQIDRRFVARC